MSINYSVLVPQGRAKAIGVTWTPEEWEAINRLIKERNLERIVAADYIRNGIKTPEEYDKAVTVDFKPTTQEEAEVEIAETLKSRGEEAIKVVKEKRKKKL